MFKDYSLKELNTWGVGGKCALFSTPEDEISASAVICKAFSASMPLYILGGGSNILVSDGMIPAAVLHTASLNKLNVKNIYSDGSADIEAGSGVSVRDFISLAIRSGLGGVEFLTGIPGTLGGALWGNAAAGGESLGPFLTEVRTIGTDGKTRIFSPDELEWEYRTCPWDKEETVLITGCSMHLKRADRDYVLSRVSHFASLKKGQPFGKKTAGCVFKNPQGTSAGKLLDDCGCKLMRIGDACVSSCHANFIENLGNASSDDIFALSEKCRARVFDTYGIKLEYEICFFGSFQKA